MTVVEKILYLISKNNITARKLVSDVGLSNSAITEWKKGKAKPSLEAIVKIAKYFHVTSDYLIMDNSEIVEAGKDDGFYRTDGIDGMVRIDESLEGEAFLDQNGFPVTGDSEPLPENGHAQKIMMHRERGSHQADIHQIMELTFDDKRLLECYHRLDEEDKEYIRCKMIVLERESLL